MKLEMAFRRFYFLCLGGLRFDYEAICPVGEADKPLARILRRAVAETLAYEHIGQRCYVSVQVCSPEHIHELNLNYRGKDCETDVLSFPLYERSEFPKKGTLELGDIVISYCRAEAQGKELGHSTHREAAFLAIHSTLHLLGYDHESSREEDEDMCRRQKEIITTLEIK